MLTRCALSLLAAITLAPLAAPQTLQWTQTGAYTMNSFGSATDSVDDLNGDGVRDILVGDFNAQPSFLLPGEMHVFSGSDGTLIHSYDGTTGLESIGFDVAGLGDLDGDGAGDFLYTSIEGWPRVFSGASGTLLREVDLLADRLAVVDAGSDLDGDGLSEVVFGMPSAAGSRGVLSVVRGAWLANASGSPILWSSTGLTTSTRLGSAVGFLGDINGDGLEDIAASAPNHPGSGGTCGAVYIFSGASGGLIRAHYGTTSCSLFGQELGNVGDWDADTVSDLAVGAPFDDNGGTNAGAVRIYSGATGLLLEEFLGSTTDTIGRAILGNLDIDGDMRAELLLGTSSGSCGSNKGTLRALDSLTKTIDFVLCGENANDAFASQLTSAGDINGDGLTDFIVTAAGFGAGGRVYLYTSDCVGGFVRYCPATLNSSGQAGTITATGSLSIAANGLSLLARSCPPNQLGVFYYGKNQVQVFVGDGWRCVGGATFRFLPPAQIDASGIAQRALDFTVAPLGSGPGKVLPGSNWQFQFWFRDPMGAGGGFNYSDALSLTFCP